MITKTSSQCTDSRHADCPHFQCDSTGQDEVCNCACHILARQKLLQAIENWQKDGRVHPLTCGVDSNHSLLVGFVDQGIVKLRCLDCDYVQDCVPIAVYEFGQIKGK